MEQGVETIFQLRFLLVTSGRWRKGARVGRNYSKYTSVRAYVEKQAGRHTHQVPNSIDRS